MVDHLFRHQFGKMVSMLTRMYGLTHLETIEDAVQDTFIKAIKLWPTSMPDNPEGWLMTASKNRIIDLLRSVHSESKRKENYSQAPFAKDISDVFLETEIEDNQLRMIFTACHPSLHPKEQISFALKTISGFSTAEIASALLTKEESIKKRLQRARQSIKVNDFAFEIPQGPELPTRLDRVLEVLYVIFNEGFQSNKKNILIRKDLCGEALRLCKLILKKESIRNPKVYALFALFCFHSSRLDSKINLDQEIISIRLQDRSKWHMPLVFLGNDAMNKAVENEASFSSYHFEAAIASEHLRATSFEQTNWSIILEWYTKLYALQPNDTTLLNMVIVNIQLKEMNEALRLLDSIEVEKLASRQYLYHATKAEYFCKVQNIPQAIIQIDIALETVQNQSERNFLLKKKSSYK